MLLRNIEMKILMNTLFQLYTNGWTYNVYLNISKLTKENEAVYWIHNYVRLSRDKTVGEKHNMDTTPLSNATCSSPPINIDCGFRICAHGTCIEEPSDGFIPLYTCSCNQGWIGMFFNITVWSSILNNE